VKHRQKGSEGVVPSVAGEVEVQVGAPVARPAVADFTETFRQEFPKLAGYCAGLVGDRDLGGDLAQEAMVRTWGRWTSVRDPHAYAFLVATNLARRAWKDRQRRAEVTAGLASGSRSMTMPVDPSMLDLIERLPPKLRDPVLLHYYADLPAERVARILHRPAGTIRQRLHEARRVLAHMLEES
jgi:RNA polymerase sigma-70 factor, ECF subfamily